MASITLILSLNIVRMVESNRNIPVPADTVIKITHLLEIPGTCSARTIKSGSAIVTIKPKIKLSMHINVSFRLPDKCEPTYPPIFMVDISTPILKSDMPNIMHSVASNNPQKDHNPNGKNTKYKTIIIAKNGKIDNADSFSLSPKSRK